MVYPKDVSGATFIHGTPITYAYDTALFIENENFEGLYIIAYEDLISMTDYFEANKLTINLNKTNYILRFNTKIDDY